MSDGQIVTLGFYTRLESGIIKINYLCYNGLEK
jgi:hypothetical protein